MFHVVVDVYAGGNNVGAIIFREPEIPREWKRKQLIDDAKTSLLYNVACDASITAIYPEEEVCLW